MTYQHQSVLLEEAIQYLNINANDIYIDATFGRGGHSQAILERLGKQGQLLAIDKDIEAVQAAQTSSFYQDARFSIQLGSFTQLYQIVKHRDWIGKVKGILLDLGVSSPQLDDASRGFSFLRDGPLDMRMDTTQTLTAASWIGSAVEQEICQVIKEYGEERYASRIAAAIVKARAESPILTTGQLAKIIKDAHPQWEPQKHPATRSFQAIRIFINNELDELNTFLNQCLDVLAVGGRLLVITFHSLEDRIVKNFIETHGSHTQVPRRLPLTDMALKSTLRIKRINGAVKPSEEEMKNNPRSRSAKLRIMEKIL